MTNEEAKKMLKAKLECLKRETSGTDIDCNYRNCDECNLCYEQGNMGEQKEALDMAIEALEQTRPKGKWIGEENLDGSIRYMCDNCKEFESVDYYDFCPNCGADMRGEDNDE